jgi:hypothetical protein
VANWNRVPWARIGLRDAGGSHGSRLVRHERGCHADQNRDRFRLLRHDVAGSHVQGLGKYVAGIDDFVHMPAGHLRPARTHRLG